MIASRLLVLNSKLRIYNLKPIAAISNKSFSTSLPKFVTASESANEGSISKNVITSPFPDVTSNKGILLQELIRSRNAGWGNQTAYECAATGLKYTHDEVFTLGRNFGAALLKAGLKRGDVASILLPNCPQYSPIVLGMFETGIVPSLMNPLHTPAEIGSMLVNANTKCIVTLPLLHPLIQAVTNNLSTDAKSSIKLIVTVPFGEEETPEGCHSYNDMIKTDTTGVESQFLKSSMPHVNTSSDTAMILWSSGTSGPPKGVIITHENMCTQIQQILTEGVTTCERGAETFLGLAPYFHIIGSIGFLALSLATGSRVITLPRFDPALFTQTLKTQKMTIMHLVPPLVGFLVANPAITKEDLSAIHTICCGAAPTGLQLINALLGKFGEKITFQEAYGLTETTGITHLNFVEGSRLHLGSVGRTMPGGKSKIVDLNTGEALGPGQNGEICIKSLQVTKGYLNNEEATRNTIDSDGWLHTGDIGNYDEQGYFHVVDRLKELIKVKGFQVSPSELEDALRTHPKVADIAVIGVPDERSGELPRAYIVSKDPSLGENEINEFLQDKVASYKQLKGGIEFVKEIPKSPSGKILRRVLLTNFNNAAVNKA